MREAWTDAEPATLTAEINATTGVSETDPVPEIVAVFETLFPEFSKIEDEPEQVIVPGTRTVKLRPQLEVPATKTDPVAYTVSLFPTGTAAQARWAGRSSTGLSLPGRV